MFTVKPRDMKYRKRLRDRPLMIQGLVGSEVRFVTSKEKCRKLDDIYCTEVKFFFIILGLSYKIA